MDITRSTRWSKQKRIPQYAHMPGKPVGDTKFQNSPQFYNEGYITFIWIQKLKKR